MKKIITVFLFLSFLVPLFSSIDESWIGKISEASTKDIEKEIKLLEKELKSDKTNHEIITKLGFSYHFLAITGKKAAQKSINYFEESLKIKEDNLIRAYYGSAIGLLGGEKLDLGYLNKSFKIIDDVILKDPENVSVLILALTNGLSMPDFIYPKREPVVKKILDTFDKMANEKTLDEGYFPLILLNKGAYLLKQKDLANAKLMWKEVVAKYPDSKQTKEAEKLLERYSE